MANLSVIYSRPDHHIPRQCNEGPMKIHREEKESTSVYASLPLF